MASAAEGLTGAMEQAVSLYAWHCRHHAAHITRLRERMGWKWPDMAHAAG